MAAVIAVWNILTFRNLGKSLDDLKMVRRKRQEKEQASWKDWKLCSFENTGVVLYFISVFYFTPEGQWEIVKAQKRRNRLQHVHLRNQHSYPHTPWSSHSWLKHAADNTADHYSIDLYTSWRMYSLTWYYKLIIQYSVHIFVIYR